MSLVGKREPKQMKTALITGIAGQDGSYLAELLLSKGYQVHGLEINLLVEKNDVLSKINHILDKIVLHNGDVSDYATVRKLIDKIRPDEVYHLATKHDLKNSLKNYLEIQSTNVDSTYFLLSAIKEMKPYCRFFFASSSKVFGKVSSSPQNEQTVFSPRSLYSISKAAGIYLVNMYRNDHNLFACSGILYNHESPRRDIYFLPRKITRAAARIKAGKEKELVLGNIDAKRDWGFAGDYVEAMWLMLQADEPNDYVIGTGEIHSVKDILDTAFAEIGLNWQNYVIIDKEFFRKEEDILMVANIFKIKNKLSWQPKISFEELIKMMVREDIRIVEE